MGDPPLRHPPQIKRFFNVLTKCELNHKSPWHAVKSHSARAREVRSAEAIAAAEKLGRERKRRRTREAAFRPLGRAPIKTTGTTQALNLLPLEKPSALGVLAAMKICPPWGVKKNVKVTRRPAFRRNDTCCHHAYSRLRLRSKWLLQLRHVFESLALHSPVI